MARLFTRIWTYIEKSTMLTGVSVSMCVCCCHLVSCLFTIYIIWKCNHQTKKKTRPSTTTCSNIREWAWNTSICCLVGFLLADCCHPWPGNPEIEPTVANGRQPWPVPNQKSAMIAWKATCYLISFDISIRLIGNPTNGVLLRSTRLIIQLPLLVDWGYKVLIVWRLRHWVGHLEIPW